MISVREATSLGATVRARVIFLTTILIILAVFYANPSARATATPAPAGPATDASSGATAASGVSTATTGKPTGASTASSAAASSSMTPNVAPTPAATAAEHDRILSFLGAAIDWYQHLSIEAQLVTEPADSLFLGDDRQMADQVVKLAFDYARASAALMASSASLKPATGTTAPSAAASATGLDSGIDGMTAKVAQVQADAARAQTRINLLNAQIARASRSARISLNSQLVAAQGEFELATSRIGALNAMLDFENKTSGNGHLGGDALTNQIDQLQHSLPAQGSAPAKPGDLIIPQSSGGTGIFELAQQLLDLQRKSQTLQSSGDLTRRLAATVDTLRAPLLATLHGIESRGDALAARGAAGDLASVERSKQGFEALVSEHKMVVAALLPLSQVRVLLGLYGANLERWNQAVERRRTQALSALAVRLIVLGSLIALIMVGALIWRRLTFRYVQDARQRHRLLQVRTLTVILLMMIVLLFNFSNEIGALATVMGLATAGVAFALQNVILSVAGYFFLSGRYGIKVGDRIQIAGVYGTVVDIGLVKLTLMELSGEGNYRQPTGRVVVFANSIVFQANGNLFKQAPGFNFSWNELSLTLAPDCDFTLAEKLLTDAVNEVCSRYRDHLHREYLDTARQLNVWFEPPEPRSRLLLESSGIMVTIRYPVETRRALDINDEISRRVLEVINREPRLRLVTIGTPAIQAVDPAVNPATDGGVASAVTIKSVAGVPIPGSASTGSAIPGAASGANPATGKATIAPGAAPPPDPAVKP